MTASLFISVELTAQLLGISSWTVNKLVQSGYTPTTTLGPRLLIPRSFFDDTRAKPNGGTPVIYRERREVERVDIPEPGDRRG